MGIGRTGWRYSDLLPIISIGDRRGEAAQARQSVQERPAEQPSAASPLPPTAKAVAWSHVQRPKAQRDLSTNGVSKSHGNQATVHLPKTNGFQLLHPNHSVPAAS